MLRVNLLLAASAVALGLLMTGCGAQQAPPAGGDNTVNASPTAPKRAAAAGVQTASPDKVKCTDQIDYSGDDRDNATINSIGARTGKCPPVEKAAPAPAGQTASPEDVKCTDQIDYSDDVRDNATINSIGADTGQCPPVIAQTASPDDVKCTDQIDYSGDPRDNATINSLGEESGRCPAPEQK